MSFAIVFDLTLMDSFQACEKWMGIVNQIKSLKENRTGVLIGNKADLTRQRVVEHGVAKDFAKKNNLVYFECSASENIDIEAPFIYIANLFHGRFIEHINKVESVLQEICR